MELSQNKQKVNMELKKHVSAIHSSNHLSLIQRKIANALLYNAYGALLTQDEHKIHIKDLCDLIGYDSKDYKTIKKALISLISTVIEWNLVDKNELNKDGVWNASSIIADASIDCAVCTYSYSKRMRDLLYHPELYGKLNLKVQACFQSSYGLALYENCIRYQNISHTPWFNMDLFRKLMGVSEDKYLIFRDFKKRVLDKAIFEVNKYSPIQVSVKLKKENRKPIALQFLITPNVEGLVTNAESGNSNLSHKLKSEYGFSDNQFDKIISLYDESYIIEKISIIESSSTYLSGKISNLAKYLDSALKENFQPAKSSFIHIENKRRNEQEQQQQKIKDEERLEKYHRFQDKEFYKIYSELKDPDKSMINKDFEKYIGQSMIASLLAKHGMTNHLVLDKFGEFIRRNKKSWLDQIISFDDFKRIENKSSN